MEERSILIAQLLMDGGDWIIEIESLFINSKLRSFLKIGNLMCFNEHEIRTDST